VLNAEAIIMCDHGGQVTLIPKQTSVLVGGAPALRLGDVMGSPIVGCALPPTPVTVPCTVVVSEIPIPGVGASLTGMCGGQPLLLEGLTGITDSVPPATIMVVDAGQETVTA
jgi:uncharacterized Zn-binding protein involved in type VI secretion